MDSLKKPAIPLDQLPGPSKMGSTGGVTAAGDITQVQTSSCPAMGKEVPDAAQQTDVWCWAASSEAVMAAHGVSISQCDIVNQTLGTNQCCADKYHGDCQRNSWPHLALNANAFQWDWVQDALPEDNMKGVLCSFGPFIAVFLYHGGGGHSFVVDGWEVIGGELHVWVQDHIGQTDQLGNFLTDAAGNRRTAAYRLVSYEAFALGEWEGPRHDHAFDYVIYPMRYPEE
jgi:hypothetical protein